MKIRTMQSDQARSVWGEILDSVLSGEVIKIARHTRPVAVLISAAMWDRIMADYERLDDAEDLIAVYRSEIKKLRGIDDGRFISDEEADEWLAEDEPIPA